MAKSSAALLAGPLVASMLLAGCGGDPKPGASPSATTTSSPKPTPTKPVGPTATASPKTAPIIPAAARAHTPAGAEAFVRHFIGRLNVAWTSPQAGILSPLCQASSKSCATFENVATRLAGAGRRYDGNPLTITSIDTLDAKNPDKYKVLAKVVTEKRSEIDAAGKTYVTSKRANIGLEFELLYIGQSWSVGTIKITQ